LKQELRDGVTDVVPELGGEAARALARWEKGMPLPQLPFEFRLRRALRIIPVTPDTVEDALVAFDQTVARIEVCRGKELAQGQVLSTWEKNSVDKSTCTACDARTFCPSYGAESQPKLPGVKA